MKTISKKGNTIIYAVILANVAIFILYIVVSKTDTFIATLDYQNYSHKLNRNIQEKADYAFKDDIAKNMDGSGFIDTISCASGITLSGATFSGQIIDSEPFFDSGSKILSCSGSNSSGSLLLTYNTSFTGFSSVKYNNVDGNLDFDGMIYSGVIDGTTNISFTGGNLSGIDSNYDDDNYAATDYPGGYTDNDNLARKNIYGHIKKNAGFYNIFWNNNKTNDYIAKNTNNLDSQNVQIGNTSTGKLYLDVNYTFNLKIIEFDSGAYLKTKELKKLNEWNGSFDFGKKGYISQNLTGNLELDGSGTDSKIFDFKNKNYGIFLEFSGAIDNSYTVIKYNLSGNNENGSGIYLNPLNDSFSSYMGYLGSDIIIDETRYLSSIAEVTKVKFNNFQGCEFGFQLFGYCNFN